MDTNAYISQTCWVYDKQWLYINGHICGQHEYAFHSWPSIHEALTSHRNHCGMDGSRWKCSTIPSRYIWIKVATYVHTYTYKPTYFHTYIYTWHDMTLHTYTYKHIQTHRQRDRQTDRQKERQTNTQTDRPTDRQTDRQTTIHAYTHCITLHCIALHYITLCTYIHTLAPSKPVFTCIGPDVVNSRNVEWPCRPRRTHAHTHTHQSMDSLWIMYW